MTNGTQVPESTHWRTSCVVQITYTLGYLLFKRTCIFMCSSDQCETFTAIVNWASRGTFIFIICHVQVVQLCSCSCMSNSTMFDAHLFNSLFVLLFHAYQEETLQSFCVYVTGYDGVKLWCAYQGNHDANKNLSSSRGNICSFG